MRDRAVRRHHRVRMMRRGTPLIRRLWRLDDPRKGDEARCKEVLNRKVRQYIKTRTPCSCFLCSGHRRWLAGPTRQENLQDLAFREEMSQLLESGLDQEIPACDTEEQYMRLANEGFNEWLAALPEDDWSPSYDTATPVRWDPEKEEFVEEPTR